MMLAAFARQLGRTATVVKHAVRDLTDIDTNPVPGYWSHVTKIDPEYEKKLPIAYPLYLRHTSAISVGGSSDVDSQNTEQTFVLLDVVDVPVFHEPSAAKHVTERTREQSEFLAIPEVLNGDSRSMVGTLGEGAEHLRTELAPRLIAQKVGWLPASWRSRLADFVTSYLLDTAVFEAYIIQNPESAAAREANVSADDLLSPTEAAQRALAAEKHLGSPVIYLEYSGTYGGDEAAAILGRLRETITWSRIWYGGGISSRDASMAVLEAGADTVVVGNVFHEIAFEERALLERVQSTHGRNPSSDEIGAWLSSELDIRQTSSFQYLSSVPEIDHPEPIAKEYLATGMHLHHLRRSGSSDAGSSARSDVQSTGPDETISSIGQAGIPDEYLDAVSDGQGDPPSSPELRSALERHVIGFE